MNSAQRVLITSMFPAALSLGLALLVFGSGCGRQTRGSADAHDQSKAVGPAQGGSTSTTGSAGRPENFGDNDAKRRVDEQSPSGRSLTGGASTGPDYTLDSTQTPTGQPAQSRIDGKESPNVREPVAPVKP